MYEIPIVGSYLEVDRVFILVLNIRSRVGMECVN